jgi:hypothetical protein
MGVTSRRWRGHPSCNGNKYGNEEDEENAPAQWASHATPSWSASSRLLCDTAML